VPSAEIDGTFTPPEPVVAVTCVKVAVGTSYRKISLLPSVLVPTKLRFETNAMRLPSAS